MIYYPIPLHRQLAFKNYFSDDYKLTVTDELSKNVLSLPIHSELENSNQDYIIEMIKEFFDQ